MKFFKIRDFGSLKSVLRPCVLHIKYNYFNHFKYVYFHSLFDFLCFFLLCPHLHPRRQFTHIHYSIGLLGYSFLAFKRFFILYLIPQVYLAKPRNFFSFEYRSILTNFGFIFSTLFLPPSIKI